jgi:hypothetical protein
MAILTQAPTTRASSLNPAGAAPSDGVTKEQFPWLYLSCLSVLAAILRIIALNQQLWYDEMTTLVQSVRLPFWSIITTYTSKNQHLLYSLLAHLSLATFGESNWALRLPAVVFGVLSVPALYLCGRRMTSHREALLAAAFMTVSYHHVWFSQNARGYSGLVFWTLTATWLFLRGMRPISIDDSRPLVWVAYGLTLALGMYTHLTMGVVVAAHGLIFLGSMASEWRRSGMPPARRILAPLGGLALAGGITLALYAPILPQIMRRTVGAPEPPMRSQWNSPLWLLQELARGLGAGRLLGAAFLVAGAAIVLAGIISYWRESPLKASVLLLPGVLTAAALLSVNQNLWPRFFFFSIGFAFLLLVRGGMVCGDVLAWFFAREHHIGQKWGVALLVAALLASLLPLRANYLYPKQDFLGAMNYVDAQRQPGEPVVVTGLAIFPYRVYYRRDWTAVETRAQLEAARAPGKSIWLLEWSPTYIKTRQPEVWNAINSEFSLVRSFGGTLNDGIIYVWRAKDNSGAPGSSN